MTRFQRINLWLGLAALSLVVVMAASQSQGSVGADGNHRPPLHVFR